MTTPKFEDIETAWWANVSKECPHPINSRHRYAWITKNKTFKFRGRVYSRRSSFMRLEGTIRGTGSKVIYTDVENPELEIEGVIPAGQGSTSTSSGSSSGTTPLDVSL